MPAPHAARSLAAIVFTDVVGYSALAHRDDANALRLVGEHFALVRDVAPAFGGRVIKTIGDSVHLEFASAQAATACAIAIQQRHRQRNGRVGPGQQFEIRIGIHLGDVEHRDGDVYGDGVNIAARLQPLAPVGGIAISDHVRGQLPEELRSRFIAGGAQALRNIAAPVEMFTIQADAIAQVAVDAPAWSGPPAGSRAPRRRYVYLGLAAVAALCLFALAPVLKSWLRGDDKSIAVLPFVNSSGDAGNEYFSDGLSEELISTLGRAGDLKVIGRTSSFQFKNKAGDSRAIGKALGAAYLVEGSVRKAADRVRIAVALVKAVDGTNSWSESYDRDLKDIFAVQSEIAAAVAGELKLKLLGNAAGGAPSRPDAPPGGNIEAYQALLQGNFHHQLQNPDDLRAAIADYEKAIRLEPDYGLAYAKLAKSATYLVAFYGGLPAAEIAVVDGKARAADAEALKRGPQLAETHAAHCTLLALLDLNFSGAAPECELAYKLAPQDPDIVLNLARWRASMGDLDEAMRLARRAIALDPLSARAYSMVFRLLSYSGDYREAESMLLRAIELQPQASQNFSWLAILRMRQGRTREAVELGRQEPFPFWRTTTLAITQFANGDRAEADAGLARLIAENANDGTYQIADVYAVRQEPERAFAWLDKSWAVRDAGVSLILWDPFFKPYRTDPRFIAFARKIGVMAKD